MSDYELGSSRAEAEKMLSARSRTSAKDKESYDAYLRSQGMVVRSTAAVPVVVGDLIPSLSLKDWLILCRAIKPFAIYVNWVGPISLLPLDLVNAREKFFFRNLVDNSYPSQQAMKYAHRIHVLMNLARSRGWSPDDGISEEWLPVLARAEERNCIDIARYFASSHIHPGDLTYGQLQTWIDNEVIEGTRTFVAARAKQRIFSTAMLSLGFTNLVRMGRPYGTAVKDFTDNFKREFDELIAYRRGSPDDEEEDDDYAEGWEHSEDEEDDSDEDDRPKRKQLREVSVNCLIQCICRMHGFAKDHGAQIDSLSDLFTRAVFRRYRKWLKKRRKIKGTTMKLFFAPIVAAVRQYRKFPVTEYEWLGRFLSSIPAESFEERQKRKLNKYLPFQELAAIPSKLRKDLENVEKRQTTEISKGRYSEETQTLEAARLAMKALLLQLEFNLVWRQRNLRQCRILGDNPNLFKLKIDTYAQIFRPAWVEAIRADDPNAEIWQYSFSAEETKAGHPIHGILPRHLIRPLEDYLDLYRPELVKERKRKPRKGVKQKSRTETSPKMADTLFVNYLRKPLSSANVRDIFCDSTLRYGKRRVTPHLVRDCFAYHFLLRRPFDFVTLSACLWHRSVSTTLEIYGSRLNPSVSIAIAEQFIEEMSKGGNAANSPMSYECDQMLVTAMRARVRESYGYRIGGKD